MSDRIKELAEQAGIEFVYDPTETPMRAFVECWEDEMQKFAELIVKECAGVADHSNVTGKSIIGERIKEHFGVDE